MKNNIKNKKNKKFTVAKKILVSILEEVLDCAGLYTESSFMDRCRNTYSHSGAISENKSRVYNGERYVKQEISRLKREKFIEERKIGNRLELCLTDKGRKAALRHKILECDNYLKNKYCLVIFDIPETERTIRNFFRMFLKESGFKCLQQSVWVTQKDITDYVTKLIHLAKAEKWVRVITADFISDY